ncbi:elongation of very long chain fatty acids protein 1-like [Uloborus diversus]|uniref:elongation of very long chain fatty acids protein 1-like n=1 Tax=Uloborus diversus TaxID=327109 RepID=UPI00240A560C|nr:elongation of very long chain fatty acids protein 1-like [Uloborus diversus]
MEDAMKNVAPKTILHSLADAYYETLIEKTDPVVKNWPLVNRDGLNLIIILSYVIFVNYLGPGLMKYRRPMDLRWLMVPYNIALVIVNFYIFYGYAKIRWSGEASTSCTTLAVDQSPVTYRLAEITWWFYITKYIELMDTVFFVLRKKDRQLSRLHLIHHSTVPLIIWGMLRFEPGGYNSFFPLANSFVHCVMYTYYGISALGDDVTVHLKFKKYVTMTQMIQFILVLCYFFSRPFFACNYTKLSGGVNIFIAGFFFILFTNFYWNEYCKKCEETAQMEASTSNGMKCKKI